MSASNGNLVNRMNPVSNTDDISMFQAVRQNGRRNAMADLGEQLAQVSAAITAAEMDNMTPHFQSMSIKP